MAALITELDAQPVDQYDTCFVPPGIEVSGFTVPVHVTLWDDSTVTAVADGFYSDVCGDADNAIADIIDQMRVELIQQSYSDAV